MPTYQNRGLILGVTSSGWPIAVRPHWDRPLGDRGQDAPPLRQNGETRLGELGHRGRSGLGRGSVLVGELFHEVDEGVRAGLGEGVVHAGAHTRRDAVAGQAGEAVLFGLGREQGVQLRRGALEGDVHQ